MSLTLTASTVTLSDEDIRRIGAAVLAAQSGLGHHLADPPRLAENERELDVEFPTWRGLGERSDESYRWPQNQETYNPFNLYEGTTSKGTIKLGIGWCERTKTWGKDRRYAITFHITEGGKRPLCEFLETDDFLTSREFVAIIRGAGMLQRSMYGPADVLPSAYRHLRTERYRDHIDYAGSWDKQAVVAVEGDVETMLNHSLIQAQLRFDIHPS
jgi:hypothetical protein